MSDEFLMKFFEDPYECVKLMFFDDFQNNDEMGVYNDQEVLTSSPSGITENFVKILR